MVTKNLLGYSFDESWNFDAGINFDSSQIAQVDMFMDVDVRFSMLHNFQVDVAMEMAVDVVYSGVTAVSLLPLIPAKFHSSEMMRDYISVVDIGAGTVLDKIKRLKDLINPYLVGRDYIGYLAGLLGYRFIGEETLTLEDLRAQLLDAVPFFKIKGTYKALELVIRQAGFSCNILDMYATSSEGELVDSSGDDIDVDSGEDVITDEDIPYSVFVPTSWFVADYVEENPPGLGPEYYKSPHFGVEVDLDRYYGDFPYYLWRDSMLGILPEAVELVRPVNTVPHFLMKVLAITHESGDVHTITSSRVSSVVTDAWDFSRQHFDESWNFDDGVNFDQDRSGFLSAIVKCKLGIGHKGQLPTYTGFAIETEVAELPVTLVSASSGKIEFKVTVDTDTYLEGLSELALCQADGTIVVASTFPDVDKTVGMELNIYLEIYP